MKPARCRHLCPNNLYAPTRSRRLRSRVTRAATPMPSTAPTAAPTKIQAGLMADHVNSGGVGQSRSPPAAQEAVPCGDSASLIAMKAAPTRAPTNAARSHLRTCASSRRMPSDAHQRGRSATPLRPLRRACCQISAGATACRGRWPSEVGAVVAPVMWSGRRPSCRCASRLGVRRAAHPLPSRYRFGGSPRRRACRRGSGSRRGGGTRAPGRSGR